MPLEKSSSKEAFVRNLKTEIHAGKPQDQALAIAYSVKRKARKKGGRLGYADGGAPDSSVYPDVNQAMPEAYMNPDIGIGAMLKNSVTGLASLPQRAFEASENRRLGGDYDPAPIVESATLPMGTGALAGVPVRAGEAVLGAGPVRLKNFFAGESLKNIPETAESLWQSNKGKMAGVSEQLGRMRTMGVARGEWTPEEIDQVENLIKDKATRPFVNQAKLDRISEKASDIKENKGQVTLEDLQAAFPKEKADTLSQVLKNHARAKGGRVDSALEIARKLKRAKGGKVHLGPVIGNTGGRSDKVDTSVPDGSYVIPSQAVSHLGENNTMAGLKVLQRMFPNSSAKDADKSKVGAVPVAIADGEFCLSPLDVRRVGGGDLEHGHRVLDHWVMQLKEDHIRTLKGLEPPARD